MWPEFHLCLCFEVVNLPISTATMSKDSRTWMKFGGFLIKLSAGGTSYEKQIQFILHSSCHSFLTKLLFLVLYYYTNIHLLFGLQSNFQAVAMAHTFKMASFLASFKREKDHSKGKKCKMRMPVLIDRNIWVFCIQSIAAIVTAA